MGDEIVRSRESVIGSSFLLFTGECDALANTSEPNANSIVPRAFSVAAAFLSIQAQSGSNDTLLSLSNYSSTNIREQLAR